MSDPSLTHPLVSIVIPSYNQVAFLPEAVESALAQTYAPVEVVVVDDGSPDDVAGVVRRYPEVRYVRRANGGLSAARNTGLAESRGELIVFLDSDDMLLPDAVATGVRHLAARPDCAFVAGWCTKITADGAPIPTPPPEPPDADSYGRLLRNNGGVFIHACVYRRSALQAVGGYDESMRSLEDWDLNLRVGRSDAVCFHDTVVGLYRQHGASMTRNAERMLAAFAAMYRRELPHARRSPEHVAALNAARRWMALWFGTALVENARAHARARQWRALAHTVRALLRYQPAAVPRELGGKLRAEVRRRLPTRRTGSPGSA